MTGLPRLEKVLLPSTIVAFVVLSLLAACAPATNWASAVGARQEVYPSDAWQRAEAPEDLGWSSEKLATAREYSKRIGSAAVMIVDDGIVVDAWGDVAQKYPCHSMRKSLLSALIGIHVEEGHIDLSRTMAGLGIDDNEPSLTRTEKQATIGDLLKARSGIYHEALAESVEMKARRPERGSHAPGTFWYYNNWDFNALGTIFEQETGTGIFEEFDRRIAQPLQMEDFEVRDCQYETGPASLHPVYAFRMSSRDLARFGLLYLRQGRWQDQQVVPADWIHESTDSHSETGKDSGYGYLWWTGTKDGLFPNVLVSEHSCYASGYRGHRVIVLPYRHLVVVHRVDTDAADEIVTDRETGALLWLILDAAGETDIGAHPLLEGAKGIQVTADNLLETWGDSTISHLDGPDGQYITSYSPDGTLTLRARESGELVDTGQWWVARDQACRQWKVLEAGEEACYHVILDGSTLRFFDPTGLSMGKVEFTRGRP